MRVSITKVAALVPLSDEQLATLDDYTDDVVNRSLKKFKEARNVEKPAAYFMGIVRNVAGLEHLQPNSTRSSTSSSEEKTKTPQMVQQAVASLSDRYTQAEIEHCEKILGLFDRISIEDPVEAQKILNRQPSDRWSLSWGLPDSFERRLRKLKGTQ